MQITDKEPCDYCVDIRQAEEELAYLEPSEETIEAMNASMLKRVYPQTIDENVGDYGYQESDY